MSNETTSPADAGRGLSEGLGLAPERGSGCCTQHARGSTARLAQRAGKDAMSAEQDYWKECMAIAAEECDLKLTPEQLDYLAGAAENGHEHYGMAFYSPPPSERLSDIESGWKRKLKALQDEFDRYKDNAETAVKQALRVHRDDHVSIEPHGEVLMHGGRTERIQ